MSTLPITIVCGFGRCGTSLLMQMLAAGGMPVHGEWPAYEDAAAIGTDAAIMATLPGKAIKMLDHQLPLLNGSHTYDFVWLDRDEIQQACSAIKLMRWMCLPLASNAVKVMARSYAKDRPKTLARLRALPGARLVRIRFEDLVTQPAALSQRLAGWLGRPLDIAAMAAQVRPRPTDCLPGMLELEQIDSLQHS